MVGEPGGGVLCCTMLYHVVPAFYSRCTFGAVLRGVGESGVGYGYEVESLAVCGRIAAVRMCEEKLASRHLFRVTSQGHNHGFSKDLHRKRIQWHLQSHGAARHRAREARPPPVLEWLSGVHKNPPCLVSFRDEFPQVLKISSVRALRLSRYTHFLVYSSSPLAEQTTPVPSAAVWCVTLHICILSNAQLTEPFLIKPHVSDLVAFHA